MNDNESIGTYWTLNTKSGDAFAVIAARLRGWPGDRALTEELLVEVLSSRATWVWFATADGSRMVVHRDGIESLYLSTPEARDEAARNQRLFERMFGEDDDRPEWL